MNISWQYNNFNVYNTYNGLNDVVYSYGYVVTATDSTSSASNVGIVRLVLGELNSIVPFNQLTQQIVQGWTEQFLDTQKITDNLIEQVIASTAQTTQGLPAPWN
jgi:hypothetical protein